MKSWIMTVGALLLTAAGAAADELELETGEILKGRVVERTEVRVVLDHPILGRLEIPGARVKSVLTDAQKAAADERRAQEAAAKKATEDAAKATAGWKSQLELGITGSEGNTDTMNFLGGVKGERVRPDGAWKYDARYSYKETEGVPTENRFSAGLRKDWGLGDEVTALFAEARYDRDQFQAWDQRGTVAAGVVRKLIREPDFDLSGRLGAAGTKEWGSGEDHVRPEGLAGLEGKWKISDRKDLAFQSTWYPDLADTPEYRLLSSVSLSIRLDDRGGLSLRLGAEHEYDTHRVEPFKRTDVRYFALLVMDF
jgi:putative salt-induced outer membrane protein YdiY